MARVSQYPILLMSVVSLAVYGLASAEEPQTSQLAHQAQWEFEGLPKNPWQCMLHARLKQKFYGFTLKMDNSIDWGLGITVTRLNQDVYSWQGNFAAIFDVDGTTLYYVQVWQASVGGDVHAVDLLSGKLLWKTRLKGMGPIDHSGYSNRLAMRRSGKHMYFFGRESQGDYIEVVDLHAGKAVSHKVVSRPKQPVTKPQAQTRPDEDR